MSGLFGGGGDITTTEERIASLPVQSSSQGVPIALVWGRNRVSPNLLWFDDFLPIEHRETSGGKSGGKGGPTITNISYTYQASILLGLCTGTCTGINAIWKDKAKFVSGARALPEDKVSDVSLVPAGKVVAVTDLDRWESTDTVYYQQFSEGGLIWVPTSDYTEDAGTYTFGDTISVGWTVRIDYLLKPLVEFLSALQQAGFTWFAGGAIAQDAWDYLGSAHPAADLGYSGVCHVAAAQFALNNSAGLPQMTFEVDGPAQAGGGNVDANPADIVTDLVTDPIAGAGFPAALLGDLAAYRDWCDAAGLWFSPVWNERKGIFEYVDQLAKLTHSQPLWSVDKLTLVPLATDALVSGSGSYTPAAEYSTPVYMLNDDDFREPVEETQNEPADRFNRVSISYRNRANDYADAVESAEDAASIDAFGLIEAPDVTEAYEVASAAVAAMVAELLLREGLSDGGQYRFRMPINYDLLEPLDIVQIEDARIDLAPRPVRLLEIGESEEDGSLEVLAEDVQVTGCVVQARQIGAGFHYASGPPDAVSARGVMMPTAATANVQQIWFGVTAGENWGGSTVWISSTGFDYVRAGEITARARMGALADDIAGASVELNPDQVLDVNLVGTTTLAPASQADADAYRSLLWVDGELMSYRDATLTGAGRYDLGYLRRGLYGSNSPAHALGDPWMRLDDALAKINVPASDIGQTAWIKVTSRNAIGSYAQGLDEVSAMQIELAAQPSPPDAPADLVLTGPFISTYFEVNWHAAARAEDYEIEVRDLADNLLRSAITAALVFRYTNADARDDGDVKRDYTVKVRGRNAGGDGPWIDLAVSNPAPPITTGVGASGSGSSRTISWTASVATDLAGYLARWSTVNGFDPAAGGGTGFYDGTATSAVLSGLSGGTTYYVRVCAYDVWNHDIEDQIWSAQYSFTA